MNTINMLDSGAVLIIPQGNCPMNTEEKPMTVKDAAQYIKNQYGKVITEGAIRKAIREGWLKAETFGPIYQIYRNDLDAWWHNEQAHRPGPKD